MAGQTRCYDYRTDEREWHGSLVTTPVPGRHDIEVGHASLLELLQGPCKSSSTEPFQGFDLVSLGVLLLKQHRRRWWHVSVTSAGYSV